MTVLNKIVQNWDGANRRIYLKQGVSDYFPIEDLYHEYRNERRLNEDFRKYNPLIRAEGNVSKGAGAFTPRYLVLLEDTKIIPFDESLQTNQLGDIITDNPDVDPSLYDISGLTTAKPIFIKPSEAETIQLNSESIVFSSFQGAVWIDESSPYDTKGSAAEPNGNTERPVNNVLLATEIAAERGFRDIRVIGDLHTNDITHDLRGLHLIGVSHINSIIDIGPLTLCETTRFSQFEITGVLDGDSEIRDCVVRDLTYFNGHIHDSYLVGTITLAGNLNANIEDCSILDFSNPPIIDTGGSGQDLMMPNYSGIIYIDNLTGNSVIGVGLDAGQIIINPTCTAGAVQVSGTGSVVDNSGVDCYVIDSIINGTDVQNLSRLLELLRPHHTGTGTILFWNPENGNDGWDGKHADRATKTFAQAHSLAEDNHHDIIVCVSGSATGQTVTNESLVITKNYLFVRGPGRDFLVHNTFNDAVAAIDIQGVGVEISGLIVSSNASNSVATIKASGDFPLLKDIWVENGSNGILLDGASSGSIENVRIRHNTGYGVRIQGQTDHFIISDTHIASNTSDGVQIGLDVGSHEVIIGKDSVIHNNGGYGIDIEVNTEGVILDKTLNVFSNALAPIRDSGINTRFTQHENNLKVIDGVWDSDLSTYAEGTAGETVNHLRNLAYTVFLDTSLGVNGDGSQHEPFNTENSAVDFAEAHGALSLTLQADVDFTRQIKNFLVTSTNIASVDFGNQNMDGSRFDHLTLKGSYTGSITAQDCNIQNNTTLNGFFENCAIGGIAKIPDNGIALLQTISALVSDLTPPTISIGGVSGTAKLNAMGFRGGLNIIDCNQATDIVKIVLHGGLIIIDASCTNGQIRLFGNGIVINNGTVVDFENNVMNPIVQGETHEMLGLSKGNPVIIGDGKYSSNNLDVDVTDNGDGTYTLDRN